MIRGAAGSLDGCELEYRGAAAPQLDDDDGDHQQATTAAVLFLEFTSPLLLLSHALHTIVVLPEN